MDALAKQIAEHFPTEDKVFFINNKILKGHTFLKDLFSNSRRNLGVIGMVPEYAVAFISVFTTLVET